MSDHESVEAKRAAWHSRRGMLELDVFLLPFTEGMFLELSRAEKDIYLRLLDHEDPDLFTWFMENKTPDDEALAAMVQRVKEYARTR